MAEVIRMPRMSDTMEEGNIVSWLVSEGDQIESGDTLAEVETDKATMELDAFQDGVLLHIAIKEGTVPIDGVIAVIGEEGEDWKAALEEARQKADAQAPDTETSTTESTPEPEPATTVTPPVSNGHSSTTSPAPVTAPANGSDRVKASPLARKMASDAGVQLAQVQGSGDHGRIIKRDIEAYLKKAPSPAPTSSPAQAPAAQKEGPAVIPFVYGGGEANFEQEPLSQMRKTIARRLGESKFQAPHFYLTMEIDMAKAIDLRKQLNEVAPQKISFNDLVVKAVAAALRQHPDINSSWQGDHIRYNRDVHIGVAVAVDEGLLVPVVRYADMKTLSQINAEVRSMAEKAKNRQLSLEEMQGNTFTISNLGMFGIEEFTAIINPPDACILAVGAIQQKPVVDKGDIVIGHRMKVTLSCDHRVVDGAKGAVFLQTLQGILEDPIRLMV